MASASWPGARRSRVRLFTRNGYGFHRALPEDRRGRRRACRFAHACSTARPSWSTSTASRYSTVLRYRLRDHDAVLCAFDLIELDGEDLRRRPLEHRKATLADLLRDIRDGVAFNQHFARRRRDASSGMPARSAAKASSRSGSARTIVLAASITGSRSRTRRRQR